MLGIGKIKRIHFIGIGGIGMSGMAEFLKNNSCQNMGKSKPKNKFFVTDFPQKFDELGSRFLGRKLENVQHISLM